MQNSKNQDKYSLLDELFPSERFSTNLPDNRQFINRDYTEETIKLIKNHILEIEEKLRSNNFTEEDFNKFIEKRNDLESSKYSDYWEDDGHLDCGCCSCCGCSCDDYYYEDGDEDSDFIGY